MTNPQGHYDWSAYFDAVKENPPRETLVRALDLFEADSGHHAVHPGVDGHAGPAGQAGHPGHPGHPGHAASPKERPSLPRRLAVDLGAGEGRDTAELLRRGWKVIAIDVSPETPARIAQRLERVGLSTPEAKEAGRTPSTVRLPLTPIVARYEDAAWPRCHLVNASFSIPHCRPEDFPTLWSKIADSLHKGGRFSGQFFGVNDEWARKPDGKTRTYHSRAEVESMLRGFEAEHLDEVERPGKNAFGDEKYWHVFHVVARKK